MSDTSQECPGNLRLVSSPVRACSHEGGCYSQATFPSNNLSYSRVCGRVIAIQRGSTGAFGNFHFTNSSLEDAWLSEVYVQGVSLTHGDLGSQQHIWTFASALYETDSAYDPAQVCPCTNTNFNWPYQIPSYVGNNYFCDTGNAGPGFSQGVYVNDPLWDGEGCGPTSTCCQLNNPPWFCTTLPQPTTDDIRLRICGGHTAYSNVYVQLVDIYVN